MHLWDAAAFKLHKYVCTWRILQNATAALQWQGSKTVFGNWISTEHWDKFPTNWQEKPAHRQTGLELSFHLKAGLL